MPDLEVVGRGATTTVYRDGDTAIKLYAGAPPGEAEREAELQTFAREAGLPVPEVYGVRSMEGGTALCMRYIPGQPLMRERMEPIERRRSIGTLAELQAAVHAVDGRGVPVQADRLRRRIESARGIEEDLKRRLMERLSRLDAGEHRLCHGDFHSLNVLFDGEEHWIIDWVDATAGSPLADACRTYLIFRQHMSRCAGIYLRAFCDRAGADEADVLEWLPVVAAARARERLDDRGRALMIQLAQGC